MGRILVSLRTTIVSVKPLISLSNRPVTERTDKLRGIDRLLEYLSEEGF
jgi:hypothetical protein